MIKIEDFKNVPVGTTVTRPLGNWVMKIDDVEPRWIRPGVIYLNDEDMVYWNYRLDQPTSAREALDLAWELAHEVKEGQVIPVGTRYLEKMNHGLIRECVAERLTALSDGLRNSVRTLEPLPDPKPDWVNAPAVIAVCNDTMDRDVFVRRGDNSWRSEFYGAGTADLRNVTPLYPKGQES